MIRRWRFLAVFLLLSACAHISVNSASRSPSPQPTPPIVRLLETNEGTKLLREKGAFVVVIEAPDGTKSSRGYLWNEEGIAQLLGGVSVGSVDICGGLVALNAGVPDPFWGFDGPYQIRLYDRGKAVLLEGLAKGVRRFSPTISPDCRKLGFDGSEYDNQGYRTSQFVASLSLDDLDGAKIIRAATAQDEDLRFSGWSPSAEPIISVNNDDRFILHKMRLNSKSSEFVISQTLEAEPRCGGRSEGSLVVVGCYTTLDKSPNDRNFKLFSIDTFEQINGPISGRMLGALDDDSFIFVKEDKLMRWVPGSDALPIHIATIPEGFEVEGIAQVTEEAAIDSIKIS